ncbi:MAG: GDP-L-fucose synthase [Deltaproteobacteria bacterium]|nr:GDP-L-fucose synthase [Deltaproteobacteria bacterium]
MPSSRIFVAGHRGMVGSAIVRALQQAGCNELILRSRAELDLTDERAVRSLITAERPDIVVLAAAKVGGIQANNSFPADFIRDNLAIQSNVLNASLDAGVQRLLFMGSSCIYPRECPQPIRESYLLTGPLEPTNEAYAVAKIAGITTCRAFNRQHGTAYLPVMPCNLYGPNDNYHPTNSHVIPALLRRFHEAARRSDQEVVMWGTGQPLREFLHADDLAAACLMLLRDTDEAELINVGAGADQSIRAIAELIAEIVGFGGTITHDLSKPDGTPRKIMDIERIRALGWQPSISLRDGLRGVYGSLTAPGGLWAD